MLSLKCGSFWGKPRRRTGVSDTNNKH